MRIELVRVENWGIARTTELLNRAFADYLVKIAFTEASLATMVTTDSVSLADSCVALVEGEPAGVALIARRGDTSRVAGMALVPAARRCGAGGALVRELLAQARARRDRRMLLEVITTNAPAVRLYEQTGFRRLRQLVGFTGAGSGAPGPDALVATELGAVGAMMTRWHDADWPWQISGATVATLAAPHVGWRAGRAWGAISDPALATITVRGLAVEGGAPDRGAAVEWLRGLMARHAGKQWRASAVWPESCAAWFEGAGWVRSSLAQWQMEYPL